jgi:hypothetical protein
VPVDVRWGGEITRDEVILLTSQQEIGPHAKLRGIGVWVEERQETMVFVTHFYIDKPGDWQYLQTWVCFA